MDLKRSLKEIQAIEIRGSDSSFTLDHAPSLTMDPRSTSASTKDSSLATGPPTIQVCSDEMMAAGFLEIPSRSSRVRSPSVSDLPRPRSPSISEAVAHRQERRLSFQLQASGMFEDDCEEQLEEGIFDHQRHRGLQLSPGFFRPTTRSRAEEPYVFSMSQAPSSGGRMTWDRRGSAPIERLQQTSEPPRESFSQIQKSSAPEKLSLPIRAGVPAPKEMTKKLPGALHATSSVDRCSLAGPHSRWATRALSLPVSECLMAVASGPPEAPGSLFILASPEGATDSSGSRLLSEQTRSLLLCPPELPGRRRSVSTEWCSHLESIAEESASLQKSNRRFSIPSLPATDM